MPGFCALSGSGGAGGGGDPHAGRPAEVVGGRAVGAGTAGLGVDWHGVLRVAGSGSGRQVAWPGLVRDRRRGGRVVRVWRLWSTVPDRGAGHSHRADRAGVGLATRTRPTPARCHGLAARGPAPIAGPLACTAERCRASQPYVARDLIAPGGVSDPARSRRCAKYCPGNWPPACTTIDRQPAARKT